MSLISSTFCTVLDDLRNNVTLYQNLKGHQSIKKMFEPCLYGDGSFGDINKIWNDSVSLQAGLGSLYLHMRQHDFDDPDFVDAASFGENFALAYQEISVHQYNT